VSAPTAILVDVDTVDPAETVDGDTLLLAELVGYIDNEVNGSYMHQR
jgi:hypothetical protein